MPLQMHAMALSALSLSHIGTVCVDKITSADPRTGYLGGSDLLLSRWIWDANLLQCQMLKLQKYWYRPNVLVAVN